MVGVLGAAAPVATAGLLDDAADADGATDKRVEAEGATDKRVEDGATDKGVEDGAEAVKCSTCCIIIYIYTRYFYI
jgi:hypothetical protein